MHYFARGLILMTTLLISSLQQVTSQTARRPIVHNSIAPPAYLVVGNFINAVTQDKAYITWFPSRGATSYKVRLYTREDDVLQREITNLRFIIMMLDNLQPNTSYSVTVSAVFRNRNGIEVESAESRPVHFKTREVCQGGQIWTDCDGGCIATCDNPDPVCSRACRPGCNCPVDNSIWDGSNCVVANLCPTERGIPVKVENLRILTTRNRGANVLLTWDIHEGAYVYEVTVRLANNRSVVVHKEEVNIPIVDIVNLAEGEIYAFAVVAYVRRIDSVLARSALLPPPFFVTNITENSFAVSWLLNKYAAKYAFVLYDESGQNILYENEKIAGTSILLEQLLPGTTYLVALAASGRNESTGIFSPLTRVTTLGEKNEVKHTREATITKRIQPLATRPPPTRIPASNQTRCLQAYEGVEIFYQRFPNVTNGLRYPQCDENGLYVTTLCQVDQPTSCRCIQTENGKDRKGSLFGGSNSHFPLDCDKYGDLQMESLALEVVEVRSSSITLKWKKMKEVTSYIIYLQNLDNSGEEKTISVNAALNEYSIEGLHPGNNYEIGIYVASATNGTSQLELVRTATALVDRPGRLRVRSSTLNNLTVTWRVDPTAEAFAIRLILKESQSVVHEVDELVANKITLQNLIALKKYIFEIRAIGYQYARNVEEPTQFYSEPRTIEVVTLCELPTLDIVFAFEASLPTKSSDLQSMKALASNLILALPRIESERGIRVAAVRYNYRSSNIFNFKRFKMTSNAYGALRFIRYVGAPGSSNAELRFALAAIRKDYFGTWPKDGYRKRNNAVSVVIIFTSGRTRNGGKAIGYQTIANSLKTRTKVITVGVQGFSDPSVLRNVASSSNLAVMVPSFDELERSEDIMLDKLCSLTAGAST